MRAHGPGPQRPFMYVQLEVHAKCELRSKHSEEEICERAMCARRELPAAVCVPQDVTSKSERDTRGLLRTFERDDEQKGGSDQRTCNGTCQRLRERPSTMPMGKRIPQTDAWRNMCIQSIASTGALAISSVIT